MFGEHSRRLPSPWSTPPVQTPPSAVPRGSSASSLSQSDGSNSEDDHINPAGEDEDNEGEEESQGSAVRTTGGDSSVATASYSSQRAEGIRRLSAEVDERGHIEYKLKLSAVTPDRFNRLTTQLKWRLLEGGGEAMYEIGVLDDGTLVGLSRAELVASLDTLERMAGELGATVIVLKEIRLDPSSLADDDSHSGGSLSALTHWERWQASVSASAAAPAAVRPGAHSPSGSSRGGLLKSKAMARRPSKASTAAALARAPGSADDLALQDLPSSSPVNVSTASWASSSPIDPSEVVVDELAAPSNSQNRSLRKRRGVSPLDSPAPRPGPTPARRRPKKRTNAVVIAGQAEDEDEDEGVFAMFDLDLALPTAAQPLSSTTTSLAAASKRERTRQEKAARKQLKRALQDEELMRSLWGDGLEEDDDAGDAGVEEEMMFQSLDDFASSVTANYPTPPAAVLSTSFTSASTTTAVPSPPLSSSPPTAPSPLLLPTYRPQSDLLHIELDAPEEDGTERLCVEALVLRKEEGGVDFGDVALWMSGKGSGGFA